MPVTKLISRARPLENKWPRVSGAVNRIGYRDAYRDCGCHLHVQAWFVPKTCKFQKQSKQGISACCEPRSAYKKGDSICTKLVVKEIVDDVKID